MPQVSIIMPVYNSRPYLAGAVNSVLSQTENDLELIMVDDLSTDGSGDLCDTLAQRDTRTLVVHNERNLGISGSRNVGLSRASGAIVGFCDDDDFMEPTLLEENLLLMSQLHADMVKFGHRVIDVDQQGVCIGAHDSAFHEGEVVSAIGNEKWQLFDDFRSANAFLNVWNGLYRRATSKKDPVRFDETMLFGGEDGMYSLDQYEQADVVALNPNVYYTHYRRPGKSNSLKFSQNKIDSLLKLAQRETKLWTFLPQSAPTDLYRLDYIKRIIRTQICAYTAPLTLLEKRTAIHNVLSGLLRLTGTPTPEATAKDQLMILCVRWKLVDVILAGYELRNAVKALHKRQT